MAGFVIPRFLAWVMFFVGIIVFLIGIPYFIFSLVFWSFFRVFRIEGIAMMIVGGDCRLCWIQEHWIYLEKGGDN